MSTELREVRKRTQHHQRDYSLGRERWMVLKRIETLSLATDRIRCECGAFVCFTTDGDGNLVALEARSRTRHECLQLLG